MNTVIATATPLNSLIDTFKKVVQKRYFSPGIRERRPAFTYNVWADNNDIQSGNLMLDMDEAVFSELLTEVKIKGKLIADIGCGTGRHWPKFLKSRPAGVTGFDVSAGKLRRLEEKFPKAQSYQVTDNLLTEIADASYDVIISTLTVTHIENIEEAITAWCRILKTDSNIILTDFYPNALSFVNQGGFKQNPNDTASQNFIHYLNYIEILLLNNGFKVISKLERKIDESVTHYYEARKARPVYDKFQDSRMIYGVHLRRGH